MTCPVRAVQRFRPPVNNERDRLFNSGWYFHRGDVTGAEAADFDHSQWRQLDVPHDWSIEPIPETEAIRDVIFPVFGEWKMKRGDSVAYADADFDDSDWETARLGPFPEGATGIYYWFRKTIERREGSFYVNLGKIDDCDEVYFNGEKIGEKGVMPKNQPQGKCISAWTETREYLVPASLVRSGTNVLAVCVYNHEGPGGFTIPQQDRNNTHYDTQINGPFTTRAPGQTRTGYTIGGTGWYRKTFHLDNLSKRYEIVFGGVYMNSDVWINGHHVGFHPYGYTSFYYDITPYVRNGENVISVRVRNEGTNSRWYSGSGIYRNVWLTAKHKTSIRRWGVQITTPNATQEEADVVVRTEVNDAGGQERVDILLVDESGQAVGRGTGRCDRSESVVKIKLKNPKLWDIDAPHMYSARIMLYRGQAKLDQVDEPFGIRTIRYSVDKGFQLNGRTINMFGGCVHHDNGLLGACAFSRAEWRKIEILKATGYNAVRCAHNPMSDAFYEACDRIGLLVMDEVFDQWTSAKTPQDYAMYFEKWHERDVELWVRRNRNHPSIVMWSVANEVTHGHGKAANWPAVAKKLVAEVKRYDTTRPVTGGAANGKKNRNYLGAYEIAGYNYGDEQIVPDHKAHPDWISVWTESGPGGCLKHKRMSEENPWLVGFFTWAAMEYLGESWSGWVGIQGEKTGWPSFAAACGAIDLAGFPKGLQHYRNVVAGVTPIEVMVEKPLPAGQKYRREGWSYPNYMPCWTWPGFEGIQQGIRVVTYAPEVRLLLNGQIVGKGYTTKEKIHVDFRVPYNPGKLVAEGLENGKVVCRKELVTAGTPQRIRLTPDRKNISAGRQDLCYVTVEVTDAEGQAVQYPEFHLEYSVTGDGVLETAGNGFHKDMDSFRRDRGSTYQGRSLAILRPVGKVGTMVLSVRSSGLEDGQLVVGILKDAP